MCNILTQNFAGANLALLRSFIGYQDLHENKLFNFFRENKPPKPEKEQSPEQPATEDPDKFE
ncbi:MAG: hypothetical protein CMI52_03040 [Parcubacteria group bacterium]|nr:hypothetical protein [Parcubacteria group bacterium]